VNRAQHPRDPSRASLAKRGRWSARLGALALLGACVACTEGSGSVTRMVSGIRYEGRFISPEAYADYTLGIEHEARSEYEAALTWYLQARAEDPESPEIWARIGAVECFGAAAPSGPRAATRAFENGIRLDANYYGNYFERARCEERARTFDAGLSDAIAAVARRPGDEPANLLVARLMQALGRAVDARLWLEAFQSFRDTSPAMQRALEAARQSNATNVASSTTLPNVPGARTASDIAATPSHARSVAFADLRAGQPESARKHAQIELGADPSNADAWIATLVACDALRDNVCFDSALNTLRTPSLPPSDTALQFLSELLARRSGATLTR
jgi:tetratricopeptide (TPR) repeat protein